MNTQKRLENRHLTQRYMIYQFVLLGFFLATWTVFSGCQRKSNSPPETPAQNGSNTKDKLSANCFKDAIASVDRSMELSRVEGCLKAGTTYFLVRLQNDWVAADGPYPVTARKIGSAQSPSMFGSPLSEVLSILNPGENTDLFTLEKFVSGLTGTGIEEQSSRFILTDTAPFAFSQALTQRRFGVIQELTGVLTGSQRQIVQAYDRYVFSEKWTFSEMDDVGDSQHSTPMGTAVFALRNSRDLISTGKPVIILGEERGFYVATKTDGLNLFYLPKEFFLETGNRPSLFTNDAALEDFLNGKPISMETDGGEPELLPEAPAIQPPVNQGAAVLQLVPTPPPVIPAAPVAPPTLDEKAVTQASPQAVAAPSNLAKLTQQLEAFGFKPATQDASLRSIDILVGKPGAIKDANAAVSDLNFDLGNAMVSKDGCFLVKFILDNSASKDQGKTLNASLGAMSFNVFQTEKCLKIGEFYKLSPLDLYLNSASGTQVTKRIISEWEARSLKNRTSILGGHGNKLSPGFYQLVENSSKGLVFVNLNKEVFRLDLDKSLNAFDKIARLGILPKIDSQGLAEGRQSIAAKKSRFAKSVLFWSPLPLASAGSVSAANLPVAGEKEKIVLTTFTGNAGSAAARVEQLKKRYIYSPSEANCKIEARLVVSDDDVSQRKNFISAQERGANFAKFGEFESKGMKLFYVAKPALFPGQIAAKYAQVHDYKIENSGYILIREVNYADAIEMSRVYRTRPGCLKLAPTPQPQAQGNTSAQAEKAAVAPVAPAATPAQTSAPAATPAQTSAPAAPGSLLPSAPADPATPAATPAPKPAPPAAAPAATPAPKPAPPAAAPAATPAQTAPATAPKPTPPAAAPAATATPVAPAALAIPRNIVYTASVDLNCACGKDKARVMVVKDNIASINDEKDLRSQIEDKFQKENLKIFSALSDPDVKTNLDSALESLKKIPGEQNIVVNLKVAVRDEGTELRIDVRYDPKKAPSRILAQKLATTTVSETLKDTGHTKAYLAGRAKALSNQF